MSSTGHGTEAEATGDDGWIRDRPYIPGFGVPDNNDGMLDLNEIRARLATTKNYWIVSVSEDGKPHSVPVWAAFVDDVLYFGCGPRTARNLSGQPHCSVHLESGSEVVVLEGAVRRVKGPAQALSQAIDDQYGEKYNWRPSSRGDDPVAEGWFALAPQKILAWTTFPDDATRWRRLG